MVSTRRICLDKNGGAVTDGPKAVKLLIGKGGEISEKVLVSHGCSVVDGKIYLPGEVLDVQPIPETEIIEEIKAMPAPANKVSTRKKYNK